jgi:hypothetical protein
MGAAGIDVAVLSHTSGGVEGISHPAVAVDTARRVNDFFAAEVAGGGGRFVGFATVALQDVAAAVKELTRAVTELGFCGAMVLSPGYWLIRRIRSAFTYATRAWSAGANGAVRMNWTAFSVDSKG